MMKFLKRPPRNYDPTDAASDRKQAVAVAKSYPKEYKPKIVMTGKKGDVYPYTIYAKTERWRK